MRVLRSEHTTAFLIGLLLLIYLVLRAIYTPVLHDEIATFFYFIQTNDFLPPNAHWDANNHLLNSFLGNLSFQLFGDAHWALRLPNVLLFPIYVLFTWKILSILKNIGLKWAVFLAIIFTGYIFEYFALCRGYGMSLGFLMAGIYFIISAHENNKKWPLFLAVILLFLAVSANLTLVYIYLMLVLFALIAIWHMPAKKLIHKVIMCASLGLFSFMLLSPLLYFSFELKSRGALYYGGNGFIEFTVKPLLKLILNSDSYLMIIIVFLLFGGLVLNFLFTIIHNFRSKRFDATLIFVILLLGSISAIFLTHYLLGVNYPEDRTAMYLVPLFMLALAFSLDKWNKKLVAIIALPLLFFPFKFVGELGVDQALFAIEERNVQEYFDYIEEASQNQTHKPTVGGYATQSFCWYYMNYRNVGKQNAMLYSIHPDTICDYQIVNQHLTLNSDFNSRYNKLNKKAVHHHNLYKRKSTLTKVLVSSADSITNWNHTTNEFLNLHEVDAQAEWADKALLIEVSGIIHSPNKPFYATISASQKDQDWIELGQERVVLSWLRYDWSDDTRVFHQRIILPNIAENAEHIQLFIWNIKSQSFLVKNLNVEVFLLH